jgi:iron complex outermembrane receptor protein
MVIRSAMLLASISALALASGAVAQTKSSAGTASDGSASGDGPEVVVTGSRVVTNGNAAPTPVTVLPTAQLLQSTPSTISDALNKLPQFQAGPSTRNITNPTNNAIGNYLDLRHFGPNRTLILIDGSRMTPTAASGLVDTNVIPQSLVQKVDIVTGGASSVYGSDAITGVVNFVLDHNFNGLKMSAQRGISSFGDATSWKAGVTGGMSVLSGRGHIEGAFEHYDSKGIIGTYSRPHGADALVAAGDGTAANPYRLVANARTLTGARGSLIMTPAALAGTTFDVNGVANAFIHGTVVTPSLESGGDGVIFNQGTLQAPLRTNQAFGRFDYEVSDTISAYVQASYDTSHSQYPFTPGRILSQTILSGNPFLPAALQQRLTAANIASFTISRYNTAEEGYPGLENRANIQFIYAQTGLNGTFLDNFKWTANYSFGRSRQHLTNVNNVNNQKVAAALDTVKDSSGNLVCQVSLTQYASRYPGCVPLNPFGPTAPSQAAWDYITDDTGWTYTNIMHDGNFSVAGSPFSTWAGAVHVAINGEYRWQSLRNVSSAQSSATIDCTGLRTCSTTAPIYNGNTTSNIYAHQNVKEAGSEILVPLLANVPLVKELDLNAAARYTDYSTSGTVWTWKIGATWDVGSGLRLRGARSRDVRAPSLQDLFAPAASAFGSFNDTHTGLTKSIFTISRGNPNLVPEVGKTTTLGAVYQPTWFSRFSLAIDYYDIKLTNALVAASPTSTVIQRDCELSNGTSPYCALIVRPLGFSDRTAANFPTAIISQVINAASSATHGIDAEMNYNFGVTDPVLHMSGRVSLRLLVSYQPKLTVQTVATAAPTQFAGIASSPANIVSATNPNGLSKTRINASVGYVVEGFSIQVVNRWQSGQWPSDPAVNYDLRPKIKPYDYVDLHIEQAILAGSHRVTPFVTVENLLNKKPPYVGGSAGAPELYYSAAAGYDIMGRYITVGAKVDF